MDEKVKAFLIKLLHESDRITLSEEMCQELVSLVGPEQQYAEKIRKIGRKWEDILLSGTGIKVKTNIVPYHRSSFILRDEKPMTIAFEISKHDTALATELFIVSSIIECLFTNPDTIRKNAQRIANKILSNELRR